MNKKASTRVALRIARTTVKTLVAADLALAPGGMRTRCSVDPDVARNNCSDPEQTFKNC